MTDSANRPPNEEEEEKKRGLLDTGSGLRTSLAIGTEIGLNTVLDAFSVALPLQQAGGMGINYLAQRIRGGPINRGEMIASGIASLIPGGSQYAAASRGGKLATSVGKGALSGAIQTTGEEVINTGELPSFQNFATGTTLGGVLGGTFDLAPSVFKGTLKSDLGEMYADAGSFVNSLSKRLDGGRQQLVLQTANGAPIPTTAFAMTGSAGGTTGGGAKVNPTRRGTQYRLFFDWENQPAKPKANIGDTVDIVPRKVPRAKNLVTRKGIKFTKPDSIDLTNGFKPTKQHKNFSEFIEDLIEADRIPARNITPQGFKAIGARSTTPDLDLYEDYIAGYFNTYNTLDGITKVALNNKTLKLGGKSLDELRDVERILKAYKLNPRAFKSGAFNPNSSTSKDIVEAFAQSKNIDDFIVKNLRLQKHHVAILDDSFALVDGLTGNDLNRMYGIMDAEGLIVGNDSLNLQLVPQELHQGFIHGTIWPIAGPNWTGRTGSARLMRKYIAKLPPDQRVKYVQQLKDAIDEINIFMDDIIDTYIKEVKKGGQITLQDKASFIEYTKRYMSKGGLVDTFDVDETIRSTSKSRRPDLEDQEFGQGQMQDDLQ